MTGALIVVAGVHSGVIVLQEELGDITVLVRTPKKGVDTGLIVTAIVVACRQRTEACGIVVTGRVAYGTGVCATVPTSGASQRFGNIVAVTAAYPLALATADPRGQLCPFGRARHVPSCGTDALHPAWVGTA